MNGQKCVVPENIHTNPTEGICRMAPLSSGFFLPSVISKLFAHPLEILLSLIEVNKEEVLFAMMPNFVSFMYILLNCITDRQIPYDNSLYVQVTNKFFEFHVYSFELYNR